MTLLAGGPVTGGLAGFLVVMALVVAAVFLFRSLLKHLRRVPESFDDPSAERVPEQTGPDETGPDEPPLR